MIKDFSFGIIPLKHDGEWRVLLICHKAGTFWSFPKGHADPGEEPYLAAKRELLEETGLSVEKLLSDLPIEEAYVFRGPKGLIHKTVSYYIAKVSGVLNLQPEEVEEAEWLSFEEAQKKLTLPQAKEVLRKATEFLP